MVTAAKVAVGSVARGERWPGGNVTKRHTYAAELLDRRLAVKKFVGVVPGSANLLHHNPR